MNQSLRVLLVEDAEEDAILLLKQLHASGYDLDSWRVETPHQMQAALTEENWDIVISDYYLGQFSGLAALKLLQETGLDLPFIIVSGEIGEEAAIATLKAGAADLVTKRNLSQIVPAVERELREAELRREWRRLEKEKQLLQTLIQDVSDAPDFQAAIEIALRRVCESTGWHCGEAWIPDPENKVLRLGESAWYSQTDKLQAFRQYSQSSTFQAGIGMPGYVWQSRQPLWIPDLSTAPEATFVRARKAREAGLGAGLAIPLIADDEVVAVVVLMMLEPCIADQQQIELISSVTHQLGAVLQRKAAEEGRRQAEAKYHSLFENAVVGIFQTTPDGHYINANPALAKIYGYDSPAELMAGLTDIQQQLYVDPSRRHEFTRLIQQYDAVSKFESQIYRKDGSIIWILENARAVRDAQGKLLYYEGFVEDVTSRHRAEEALRKSEAKYRELVQNANSIILRVDALGNITFFNEFAQTFFGYSEPEIKGQNFIRTLLPQSDASGSEATKMVREILRYPERYTQHESENIRRDGSRVWVAWTNKAFFSPDGKLSEILCIGRDITQLKRVEDELKKANEELERRVEERTTQLRQANEQLKEEISTRIRAEALLAGQNQVLELILRGAALPEVLDLLARVIEELSGEMKCAFLLLDENGVNLRHVAAPLLPEAYNRAVDGIAIGPKAGSCGTAAYRKEPVIVEDIASDPLWEDWRDLALGHGLRACWAIPILTLKGDVLGTIGIYYGRPYAPSDYDHELIIKATYLAGIAIERDRSSSALIRSEARFQKLAANVPGIIYQFLLQPDGSISFPFVSSSCQEVYEVGPEEIQENASFVLEAIHRSDRASFQESIVQSAQTLQPWNWEGRITTPSGKLKWIQGAARPERLQSAIAPGNQETLWDGLLMDITERKRAQEALEQSEAKLRQQARELEQALYELQRTQTQLVQTEKMSNLGQLVAGVAHEINNPISFIYGNLDYACEYTQDLMNLLNLYRTAYPNPTAEISAKTEAIDLDFLIEDLPKMLSSMKLGTDRICQIVLSLRNFSRVDQSAMQLVNVHDGLDSTLLILHQRLKGKSGSPGIEIIKEYGNLPLVECYAGQLNQVFMNIIANAIDALDEYNERRTLKEIGLHPSIIRIRTEIVDDELVVIRIADNGPGIPEEVRSQLFDSFFTTKPVGKGTGLGLSISHQIVVEKHRGKLLLTSELGKGTEFAIAIPLRQED